VVQDAEENSRQLQNDKCATVDDDDDGANRTKTLQSTFLPLEQVHHIYIPASSYMYYSSSAIHTSQY